MTLFVFLVYFYNRVIFHIFLKFITELVIKIEFELIKGYYCLFCFEDIYSKTFLPSSVNE